MKIYKKADGTEYIYFTSMSYEVDEIIELLEQHRGKTFYSGALEDPTICITDDMVQFEGLEYFTDFIAEEDEPLAEDIYNFFMEETEDWVVCEDDRRQEFDDDTDEEDDW